MNIRKHWKKVLLSSTAFFWVSCGGDSESVSVTGGDNNETLPDSIVKPDDLDGIKTDTLYGARPVYDIDSGAVSNSDACESSSSAEETLSSSSETESSSSEIAQSSSSKTTYPSFGTYKLARDTSTTCEVTEVVRTYLSSRISSPTELMDSLENNTTLSVEALELVEDNLEESLNYGVLYGSPSTTGGQTYPSKFECTNDSTYTTSTHVAKDGVLYTKEEYKEKFPNQDPNKPSPLCQKTDFILCGGAPYMESGKERTFVGSLPNNFESDKETLIDSVKATFGNNLPDALKNCLDSNVTSMNMRKDIDGGTTYMNPRGPIATKQICDGDTTVNPRYQAKLDSNKAYVRKQINECLTRDD